MTDQVDPDVLVWWLTGRFAPTHCEGAELAVVYLVREMIRCMRGRP